MAIFYRNAFKYFIQNFGNVLALKGCQKTFLFVKDKTGLVKWCFFFIILRLATTPIPTKCTVDVNCTGFNCPRQQYPFCEPYLHWSACGCTGKHFCVVYCKHLFLIEYLIQRFRCFVLKRENLKPRAPIFVIIFNSLKLS